MSSGSHWVPRADIYATTPLTVGHVKPLQGIGTGLPIEWSSVTSGGIVKTSQDAEMARMASTKTQTRLQQIGALIGALTFGEMRFLNAALVSSGWNDANDTTFELSALEALGKTLAR